MPPMDPCDRLEARLTSLEDKMGRLAEAMASLAANLTHLSKIETRLDSYKSDLDAAHGIIRQNKMVIDAIKWTVMLIVPATLSVFAAFAVEIIK